MIPMLRNIVITKKCRFGENCPHMKVTQMGVHKSAIQKVTDQHPQKIEKRCKKSGKINVQ